MPKETHHKKRITPVIEEVLTTTQEEVVPAAPTEVLKEELVETKMEDQPKVGMPEQVEDVPPHSQKNFSLSINFFAIVVGVAIFVAFLAGGLYVYFNGISGLNKKETVVATPLASTSAPSPAASAAPLASVSPTATPVSVKLDQYKVSVLNGTGKIGEAGVGKTMLEKVGFKVSQVGNANSFNTPQTTIQVKESVSAEVVTKIKEALKPTYDAKENAKLDSKNTFDIIVTLGSK